MDDVEIIVNIQEKWGLEITDFIETMTNDAMNDEIWWTEHDEINLLFNDFVMERYDSSCISLMFENRETIFHNFFVWFVEGLKENTIDGGDHYIYITMDN